MRNICEKVVHKIETNFMYSNYFFYKNRVVSELMCRNMVQPEIQQI